MQIVYEITAKVQTAKGRIPRRGSRTEQIRRVRASNGAAAKRHALDKLSNQGFKVLSASVSRYTRK